MMNSSESTGDLRGRYIVWVNQGITHIRYFNNGTFDQGAMGVLLSGFYIMNQHYTIREVR